jgi:hypothetical protein
LSRIRSVAIRGGNSDQLSIHLSHIGFATLPESCPSRVTLDLPESPRDRLLGKRCRGGSETESGDRESSSFALGSRKRPEISAIVSAYQDRVSTQNAPMASISIAAPFDFRCALGVRQIQSHASIISDSGDARSDCGPTTASPQNFASIPSSWVDAGIAPASRFSANNSRSCTCGNHPYPWPLPLVGNGSGGRVAA